jgi:uncharacterized membrane protein
MSSTAANDVADAAGRPKAPRLTSVDMLRGAIMILMALDHVRDYFHARAWLFDPTDPAKTDLAVFVTRWITHFCAPGFMLLAGMSAFLQGAHGKTRRELAWFLITRGLWLIVLELTIINFAWNFTIPGFGLIVIWALGVSMIALAGLIWLPRWTILAVAVTIIAGHNLLDGIKPADLGALGPLWQILKVPGFLPPVAFVGYPVLPWIGVMGLGYALGPLLLEDPKARDRKLVVIGLAMIAAFFVVRGINLYGDPRPWSPQADGLRTAFSFMNVSKYPPSLDYVLITVGPLLLALAALERARGWWADILLVYGRAPLVFYIAHLYLLHLIALGVGMAMGFDPKIFIAVLVDPRPMIEAKWGFSLLATYGFWVLVTALLYPLCAWWGELKRRRRDWWLSYL